LHRNQIEIFVRIEEHPEPDSHSDQGEHVTKR